ncbi:hypothetical protein CF327_g3411 [Tilletia walkeri]|uniref:NodB homology domain-containing protein n=1 Tax=Tilletia walkeri TaxID=117179 RepID=A0A8X7N3A6_9BASI|nr:hypothetical protein CF327_g3411 [Tilletia walkeri]KAE8265288.1 hypothetical protein A4X09_0g6694 [Tilletia walkeri]
MFSLKSSTLSLVLAVLGGQALVAAASTPDFPPLSPLVRADLERRDPKDYQLFHNEERSGNLSTRAVIPGGITRCNTHACFSFTFDDGPYHQKIADEIASIGTRATFFVNGNNYQCIYDDAAVKALKYSYNAGHQICSHTWSHPDIETISRTQLRKQVQLVEDALYKILGVVPSCIRPPYGSASDATIKFLNDLGYNVILWNADTKDADGAAVNYSLNQYRALKAPKHVIILNHETVPSTSKQTIPQALQIVQNNGYEPKNMGTVAQTVGFSPYKVITTPGKRDSTWTCAGKPQPGGN